MTERARHRDGTSGPLVLPLPGNEALAAALAREGGWEQGRIETRRFPDGETYLRVLSGVRDRDVALVCTLAHPDEATLRLLFAADAIRSLGARAITLVAPYLAYMRQDRRFHEGEAVTSQSFARLLSRAFDRLVTVDPHLHRYPSLASLYAIPATALHAAPLLADWIRAELPRPLVIGPDEESGQWVSDIAGRIGAPWATFRKERRGDRAVELTAPDLSPWTGLQPVLVDDIASSGRTLVRAASLLPALGFPPPACVVVHPIFADASFRDLAPVTSRVVSTDSVAHPTNAIPLAPLIGAHLAGLAPPL